MARLSHFLSRGSAAFSEGGRRLRTGAVTCARSSGVGRCLVRHKQSLRVSGLIGGSARPPLTKPQLGYATHTHTTRCYTKQGETWAPLLRTDTCVRPPGRLSKFCCF
jgi:hypothetical protein